MKTLLICALGVALAGCQARTASLGPITTERARIYLEAAEDSARVVTTPRSGVQLTIGSKPVFTEHDIAKVSIAHLDQGQCLAIQFTSLAARDLQRITAENPGRKLVLMLGDVAFGARQTEKPLDRGVLMIFVEAPDSALPALVDNLNATSAAVRRMPAQQ